MTIKGDIDQLAADAAIFHQVVHGSDTTTVATAGGTVKSIAKAVKDASVPHENAASSASAAAASASAAAASAATAAAVVSGGTAAIGGGPGKIPMGDENGSISTQIAAGDAISLSGKSTADEYYLSANYKGAPSADEVGNPGRASARLTLKTVGAAPFIFEYRPAGEVAGGFVKLASISDAGDVSPCLDNESTLGIGAYRWATIYAGTGTINTSDAREKTSVRPLTAAEIECAKALGREIGVFQFLASVAEKGDKARQHIGMTVQRAIEIFQAHGLNAMAYACICFDQWEDEFFEHPAVDAVLDEAGNVITPAEPAWIEQTRTAGNRFSFRPDQLALFVCRGLEARLSALEAA